MTTLSKAVGERIADPELRPGVTAELLDVKAVSALGVGSTRHVFRLAESERMPAPVKIGALVRWRRQEIIDWISAGCPAVGSPKGGQQ
jgi:predicted DNA-binding transcriptional regulator AlpA